MGSQNVSRTVSEVGGELITAGNAEPKPQHPSAMPQSSPQQLQRPPSLAAHPPSALIVPSPKHVHAHVAASGGGGGIACCSRASGGNTSETSGGMTAQIPTQERKKSF